MHCLLLNMAIYLNTTDAVEKTKLKYKSKIKELQADIDIQNNVKEQNEYIIKDLESQVISFRYAEELKDREIAKLKEELVNQDNRVRLHFTAHQTTKRQLEQLKSALDKIDKLFSSWLDGNTNLGNFCTEYKELTKHKENK